MSVDRAPAGRERPEPRVAVGARAVGTIRLTHSWLVSTQSGLVGLALIIGVGSGLGAVAFRYLILAVTWLVTGREDFSDAGRVASTHLPSLGPWFLLLAPVVGGLVYGPLVSRFAPEARGHGVPEVMVAVARRGGRIPARVAAVKSLASGLCIGTGGSVGREGPIVQIGSALGSSIGQWLRVPDHRLRLMVACGAAGGISATFNAPIAGVFFSLEIILRAFTAEAFGIVVISSVTANVIAHGLVGDDHILRLPAYGLGSAAELPLYAALGLVAGVVGWAFARVLYAVEDLCDLAWRGPEWLRPAVGGLLLGGVLLLLPEMYGVGYPVLENGIAGSYALGFLLVLLLGKMLATSLTIGIGGSGGVFAPSLFVGGMLGTAFGLAAQAVFPGLGLTPGAFGLVGMAAVFAAASHAPIVSVLIVFELTGQYSIILPLMLAVVLGTGLSHLVSRDTIYTLKLLRRGVDIDAAPDEGPRPATRLIVADAMTPPPESVHATASMEEVVGRLAGSRHGALPVRDDGGAHLGAVVTGDWESIDRAPRDARASDTLTALPTLSPDQALSGALIRLSAHETTGLPVVDGRDGVLLGWLDQRDVLAAYAEATDPDGAP